MRSSNLHDICFSGGVKMIASISSVQGVILSSQLKDMLMNVNSLEFSQGLYRPAKTIYHPKELFFVIKQVNS